MSMKFSVKINNGEKVLTSSKEKSLYDFIENMNFDNGLYAYNEKGLYKFIPYHAISYIEIVE